MSETVIKVENLSKSYLIGHQTQERYTALRDVLTNGARNLGKRLLHPFNSSTGQRFNDSTEEFFALRDVSFEIKQGDRVGIIGRNGAGKSTLLKVLSRITEPTKGRVTIDGRVASLLEVGTGFHPELTGRENIFLNGAILGMSRVDIKRKFDEIVAFAEIEKFLDTPVKRYSSGMYVRLAFAVAAHLEPEILIVDEVLAVGDAQFQKKCLGKMEDVGKEGRTVLFVSHNMAAVQRLCSCGLLLKGGRIAISGAVDDIVGEYLSEDRCDETAGENLLSLPRGQVVSGTIRFTRCRLIDSRGEKSLVLKYGEPFSVELEAISKSEYENLTFVVGVQNQTGIRVFTSESAEFGVLFDVSSKEEITTKVSFPSLVLTPGTYKLFMSIRSGRIAFDTLDCLEFKVSDQVYRDIYPHSGTFGLISVEAEWRQQD